MTKKNAESYSVVNPTRNRYLKTSFSQMRGLRMFEKKEAHKCFRVGDGNVAFYTPLTWVFCLVTETSGS